MEGITWGNFVSLHLASFIFLYFYMRNVRPVTLEKLICP